MFKRGVAIIIKNRQILLMHRLKNGQVYYVFPGGSVEEGEVPYDTTIRELNEEFNIHIKIDCELFQYQNTYNGRTRQEYYYLVKEFAGTPKLGGEEKERMTDKNQYAPKRVNLSDLEKLQLFPEQSKIKIFNLFHKGE